MQPTSSSAAQRASWRTPDGSEVEVPTHRIAHLSDPHLTAAGELYNGVIDADAAVDRAVEVLRHYARQVGPFDALVVSGDLTDTGDPDAYRRLRSATEGVASQVIWVIGNHDLRPVFHTELVGVRADAGPQVRSHDVAGLRVIALDSTIPGAGHGRLDADQLAALRGQLGTPAPHGTLVVLHHAPLPAPSTLLSYFALERESRRGLADAIAGTDVRMVLAGHHHLAQSGMLGSIPVTVAGSTAIRTDPLAPAGHERTIQAGSLTIVDVYADTVTTSVVPVDGAPVAFHLDEAGCAAVIDAHPAS